MQRSTVGQAAKLYNVPVWLVRRVVDKLPDVERFGGYRMLTPSQVAMLGVELERRGRLSGASAPEPAAAK